VLARKVVREKMQGRQGESDHVAKDGSSLALEYFYIFSLSS